MYSNFLTIDKNVSEKIDYNITLPYISSILKGMSKVKVKDSIVDDHNILKVSFVHRVKKIETTVGNFVFEYLNSMKLFLNRNDFFINPQRVRNFIDTYTSNNCELPVNLEPENYVNIQFIILSLLA